MQPFDALTLEAVLKECKPPLVNARIDNIHQVSRDEIFLSFFAQTGLLCLHICAHPENGRICLLDGNSLSKNAIKKSTSGKYLDQQSIFLSVLKKQLNQARLVGIEQTRGERVVDFIFSCLDAVGSASLKTLTAEIMGRHSNLIFWVRSDSKIITASHFVDSQMSRYRQIQPGVKYVRPPKHTKPSLWTTTASQFRNEWQRGFPSDQHMQGSQIETPVQDWLIAHYSGLGKSLAGEIVQAALCAASTDKDAGRDFRLQLGESIWQNICQLQAGPQFKPALRNDGRKYTVLSLAGEDTSADWQVLPAVNELIEKVYGLDDSHRQFKSRKEQLLKETTSEIERLHNRIADTVVGAEHEAQALKARLYADLILANLSELHSGQAELKCQNTFEDSGEWLTIPLSPQLSGVQNAQKYYQQFTKTKNRAKSASAIGRDAQLRLTTLEERLQLIGQAKSLDELPEATRRALVGKVTAGKDALKKQKTKLKVRNVTSCDGLTIYVGFNSEENDHLISHLARPKDMWFHISGESGSHVLIKAPSDRQQLPLTTIKEAAYLAASFSKCAPGSKVKVLYTQAKFVKKGNAPGTVHYKNEKTIEVDTSAPPPPAIKQLALKRDAPRSG